MSHLRHLSLGLLALAALMAATGCMHPGPYDTARVGPFFRPRNYVAEPTTGGLHRVVLLPVWGGTVAPVESAAELDDVFATALQRTKRFEVVRLSREECRRRFQAEALSASAALPHDLMATLKREFGADGVVFIDLTTFDPYRPLALGLRAKLATLDSPRLVWSFDELFSAADPTVENSARNFYLGADRGGVPADLTPAALQSPTRFAAYAASAMFDTLPPVTAPALTKSSNAAR